MILTILAIILFLAGVTDPLWTGLALLALAAYVIAPISAAIAVWWAKHTKLASGEDPEHALDKRGPSCLPPFWDWLNTPDDPTGDQGMYEPQVRKWNARGWRLKTWYWLQRNKLYGLFARLLPKYDGSKVTESTWWKLKIYECQGYREITWPLRRVSVGYKVQTLKTAKVGDTIWWVCLPAFWKTREY